MYRINENNKENDICNKMHTSIKYFLNKKLKIIIMV